MKVLHVITGLFTGGAEMMLTKLLAGLPGDQASHVVVSLTGSGPLADRITAGGVPVVVLGMDKPGLAKWPAVISGFFRLVRLIRYEKPDVVQAWMYHANLAASLATLLAFPFGHKPPVLWGIRQSDLDPQKSKRATIRIAKLGGYTSRWLSDKILCCSDVARSVHEEIGYDASRMVVIPNGFDLDEFKPDAEARARLRREIAVPDDAPLIGLVGRFDVQKDHRSFLAAAGQVRRARHNAHFLLCGSGIEPSNPELAGWIDDFDLGTSCRLLGVRKDMPHIMASLDLTVSSSAFGEGFPNVLGEAMAAGVPCVTTDVGDSRAIVGDTGRTVQARDPDALAQAVIGMLDLPENERLARGAAARRRIADNYELCNVAQRYLALYRDMLTLKIWA
ncbi:MAG TPA: glycosyltransferase [Alphaproteobacteria bacterium]